MAFLILIHKTYPITSICSLHSHTGNTFCDDNTAGFFFYFNLPAASNNIIKTYYRLILLTSCVL